MYSGSVSNAHFVAFYTLTGCTCYVCNNHKRFEPNPRREEEETIKCYSCNQSIRVSTDYFEYHQCLKNFHSACIRGESRNNFLNNKWLCPSCHNNNAPGTSGNQSKHSISARKSNTVNDEWEYSEGPYSKFNRSLMDQLIRFRLEGDILRGKLNRQENECNFANQSKVNPDLSDVFNHHNSRRNDVHEEAQNVDSNQQERSNYNDRYLHSTYNSNKNYSTNRSSQQRRGYIHSDMGIDTLEQLVNESVQRVAREAMLSDLHELANIQRHESQKATYRVLPKVTDTGFGWKLFYRAFNDTKSLYGPVENIARIEEAIKCEEIRRMGGINLFNIETYQIALDEIDARIGQPKKILLNEKYKLTRYQHLNDADNKVIISFIQQVKQYSDLVEKLGSQSQKFDEELIAHLSRILPPRLKTAWTDKYNELEDIKGEVQIKDLARFLDSKIKRYETTKMFDIMDPYKINNIQKDRNSEMSRNHHKSSNTNKLFVHDVRENDSESNTSEDEDPHHYDSAPNKSRSIANYCFFHDKEGHSSLICYSLKKMSGKEVCEYARRHNICIMCGNKHGKVCPKRNELPCIIPNCTMNHEVIFCHKRKIQGQKVNENNRKPKGFNKFEQNEKSFTTQSQDEHPQGESSQSQQSTSQQQSNLHDDPMMYDALQVNCFNPSVNSISSMWTITEQHKDIQSTSQVNNHTHHNTSSSLLSVVTINLIHNEKMLKCAILLDSGSTSSLIDEKYAKASCNAQPHR